MTTKFHSKIPSLLYSYLATEMLGPFFASFLIMNCAFFLVKLIPFLNFVLDLNIGLADFIRLFSYLFPNIFLYSLPMAAMIGVTIGFARLSSDSEILALKASGISMYQILPPVLIVAGLIALCTSFVSIKLIPQSAVSMKQLSYQLLREKISKGIKEHSFTEALGDVVVYVAQIDKATGNWNKVWVSDMRSVDNPVITMATNGRMNSNIQDMMVSIDLKNGSLHKPGNDNAQIVQFDQYQIHIPLKMPDSKATRLKRTSLTMEELLQESEFSQADNESKRKDLIEFHKRIVLPVGCLMISLIGLPLGLQARPGKKAIGIQAGLVIFVLYYVFFTCGKALAEKGVLSVWLAMWSPNFFFFGLALFWLVRVANEHALVPVLVAAGCKKTIGVLLAPAKIIYQKISLLLLPVLSRKTTSEEIEILAMSRPTIRGNAKTREYHLPDCNNYYCKDCTLEFKDIHIARAAGFKPCIVCKDFLDHDPSLSEAN